MSDIVSYQEKVIDELLDFCTHALNDPNDPNGQPLDIIQLGQQNRHRLEILSAADYI